MSSIFFQRLATIPSKGILHLLFFEIQDTFQKKSLCGVEKRTNSLQDGQATATLEIFQRATKVFQKFGCENLGIYHYLYKTTDSLLLACMMDQLQK